MANEYNYSIRDLFTKLLHTNYRNDFQYYLKFIYLGRLHKTT